MMDPVALLTVPVQRLALPSSSHDRASDLVLATVPALARDQTALHLHSTAGHSLHPLKSAPSAKTVLPQPTATVPPPTQTAAARAHPSHHHTNRTTLAPVLAPAKACSRTVASLQELLHQPQPSQQRRQLLASEMRGPRPA